MTTRPELQLSLAEIPTPRTRGDIRRYLLSVTAGPQTSQPPPMDVAIALDVSGSMEGPPLEHAAQSVAHLASRMGPGDRLGLVTFENDARVLVPSMQGGPALLAMVRGALDSLCAGGGTNIQAGLLSATALLGRHAAPARRVVVLLSDGVPNAGVTSHVELGHLAHRLRDDLAVCTLGYGERHDAAALSAIAENGGGRYAYVPTPEMCTVEAARVLGGQLDVVTSTARIRVGVPPGGALQRVYGAERAGDDVVLPPVRAGSVLHVALEICMPVDKNAQPRARLRWAGRIVDAVPGTPDAACWMAVMAAELRARARRDALAGDRARAHAAVVSLLDMLDKEAVLLAQNRALDEVVEQLKDDLVAYAAGDGDAVTAYLRDQVDTDVERGATFAADAGGDAPRARLVLVSPQHPVGQHVPLAGDMVVGRTESADLPLQSPQLSRRHFKIMRADGDWWVRDFGSTNGTCLNGGRVKEARLRDGDVIRVGDFQLTFRLDRPAA